MRKGDCTSPRRLGVVLEFFFFQAEDGIRDWSVTGVQTCALPILLIWQRMVASQMADAIFDQVSVDIEGRVDRQDKLYLLRGSASHLRFPGFPQLYIEDRKSVVWGKSVGLGGRRIGTIEA